MFRKRKLKKILVVGTVNARILARQLQYYGINVDVMYPPRFFNPLKLIKYDAIYGIYIQSVWRVLIFAKLLRKKTILHVVGTDAVLYSKKFNWKKLFWWLGMCFADLRLYVSDELKNLVRHKGFVLPIPVDTTLFSTKLEAKREYDVLYYCPQGEEDIYKREWIERYIEEHPNEKVTIINGKVPYEDMPRIYLQHKKYIRMTTHDGNPKMVYEALLCGCEVWWNGKKVDKVPEEMLMENTIPRIMRLLEDC